MSYLTYEEFKNYKTGIEISESEFEALLFYAENIISGITNNRAENLIDIIKKATATQVAYTYVNGGVENILSSSGSISETIGSYSYSINNSNQISPLIRNILYPTGLLYRGVQCG